MKKFLCIASLVSLILIGITGNVFATNDIDSSLTPYTEKYIAELKNGSKHVGSLEDIINNARNLKIAVEELEEILDNENQVYPRSLIAKQLAVPTYQQERSYWCGPANIKQVIQFINGSSASQSTYASSMGTSSNGGTYVYRMVNELNQRQTQFTYKYEYIGNLALDAFKARIITCAGGDKPVIFHTDTQYLYRYNGVSLGHYITGRGYFESVSPPTNPPQQPCVYYTDPFSADYGRGNVLGNHSDSYQNIYNSIIGNAGYFIW